MIKYLITMDDTIKKIELVSDWMTIDEKTGEGQISPDAPDDIKKLYKEIMKASY